MVILCDWLPLYPLCREEKFQMFGPSTKYIPEQCPIFFFLNKQSKKSKLFFCMIIRLPTDWHDCAFYPTCVGLFICTSHRTEYCGVPSKISVIP